MHSASVGAIEDKRRSLCGFLSFSVLCKLLVLAQAILLVPGCAAFKGYPQRATDPSADLDQLRPGIEANQIAACLEKQQAEQLACRNKIIAARLYAIDIRFSEFEESLFAQTRSTGFFATLATLGLTSAAAFAGGTASQILSGTAAFIIGGREAFQKEVLAERTLIAIHTAMRGGRTRALIRIRAGLRQSVDEYPLALGLADLDNYYNAGTVLGALIGVTESVGSDAAQAQQQLQEEIKFVAQPTLEKALCLNEQCTELDPQKLAVMQACWPTAGVPPNTEITDFMFQPAFAEQRRAVEACMGL